MTYVRAVNPRRLLQKLKRGDYANVRFADLTRLVQACGFELERLRGSHHMYAHRNAPMILNLQSVRGQAKPYQVRQVARTIAEYGLTIEGSP